MALHANDLPRVAAAYPKVALGRRIREVCGAKIRMELILITSFEPTPPFVPLADTSVLESERISQDNLLQLAAGKAIAIVIRGYCAAELCEQAAARLFADSRYNEYDKLPGVHMWGFNSSESLATAERKQQYFAEAMPTIAALRAIFAPYLSPVDRLRLELQESWPAGANLEYLDGHGLFVGQARVFGDRGALPHQDFMPWELANLPTVSNPGSGIYSQLTANIYLQIPDRGGELQLWAAGYDHEEYVALRAEPGVPGLDRTRIPAPTVQIEPEPGMLIIFHTTRPHAVLPSEGRPRMALSSFIGIRGAGVPVTYWS